jgi:hypothetical protein|mmetsp:Transcript_50446/g.84366  ORF Transcript_50446/g.84366 Transcript_50446/m.84366 type:complete len:276 (-) Transcript_50446:583-1410(-)
MQKGRQLTSASCRCCKSDVPDPCYPLPSVSLSPSMFCVHMSARGRVVHVGVVPTYVCLGDQRSIHQIVTGAQSLMCSLKTAEAPPPSHPRMHLSVVSNEAYTFKFRIRWMALPTNFFFKALKCLHTSSFNADTETLRSPYGMGALGCEAVQHSPDSCDSHEVCVPTDCPVSFQCHAATKQGTGPVHCDVFVRRFAVLICACMISAFAPPPPKGTLVTSRDEKVGHAEFLGAIWPSGLRRQSNASGERWKFLIDCKRFCLHTRASDLVGTVERRLL